MNTAVLSQADIERIERFRVREVERASKAKEKPEAVPLKVQRSVAQIIPFLPKNCSVTPNAFVGVLSPFMAAASSVIYDKLTIIAESVDRNGKKRSVAIKGKSLTQLHKTLWMLIVRICYDQQKEQGGLCCYVTAHQLLRLMGRKGQLSENDYAWLHELITDLTVLVELREEGRGGGKVNLLPEYAFSEDAKTSKTYCFKLDPKSVGLFDERSYTIVNLLHRQKLSRSPLAMALYDYIQRHDRCLPIKVETYKAMLKSDIKELYKFRQQLKAAFDRLEALGVVTKGDKRPDWIDAQTDHVHYRKVPASLCKPT